MGHFTTGLFLQAACFAISMATNSTRELLPRRPKRYAPLRTDVSSSRQLGLIDDGKAYKGTIKSSSRVVLSFKNGTVYRGGIVSSSKAMGSIKGAEYLDEAYLAAMIHFFVEPIFA